VDTLSHGLWGGAAFAPRGPRKFGAAFFFGVAPDLFSFGLFHATRPDWLKARILGDVSGPPSLAILPDFVFHAYNLTHSLVVWAVVFSLVWALRKRPFWPLAAWGLHVVCDIPTHNSSYFPTPYLWPFPTPYVEGISWATPWFMALNYGALLAAYLGIFLIARKARSAVRR
jgi:membrane-bound metal-dependent hydrolase YbcI (DUF457 family)